MSEWLSRLQTGSAATLGCVIVVHLAAPAVAALAPADGIASANATMRALEPVLVWGALGTHVISSMLRKAHIARLSSDPIRAFFRADLQTIAGRVLLPLLSIHVVLNRIAPSSEAMPINEVSPSEMGMEYVAYGFSRWPALTSALYGLLIAAGAVHIIGGMPKLMRRAGKRAPKSLWRIAALTAGVLALGVLRIALAPPSTPSYLLERLGI